MDEKKMMVRPPLAPIAENIRCNERYEKLQEEFKELRRLKVKDVDEFIQVGDPTVSLEEFNGRVEAYTLRRDAYNIEFAGVIETRDHVRTNIKDLNRRMVCVREEEVRLRKEYEEKWGDEITLSMPENVKLMFDAPDEWNRQVEICKRRHEEQLADLKKLDDLQSRSFALLMARFSEAEKFEDIQMVDDAAFEEVTKRTMSDG